MQTMRKFYVKHFLYHNERVHQVKFHVHSHQKPLISPKIRNRLLVCQSY